MVSILYYPLVMVTLSVHAKLISVPTPPELQSSDRRPRRLGQKRQKTETEETEDPGGWDRRYHVSPQLQECLVSGLQDYNFA